MSKTGFDQELNLGAILKFGIGLSLLIEILTSYGWIDRDLGIARIPISRAIELSVVDDGMGDSE
jgi:hypothetical protein